MLVLDDGAVIRLADMDDALTAVRRAARSAHSGATGVLPKGRVGRAGETLHVLGAVRGDDDAAAADRWASATVYVTGSRREHWIFLFNAAEGLVGLIAGRHIAQLRTGAASGVSVDVSARPGAITLACIGAGFQARTQVEAVARVRPVVDLPVWSRTGTRAESFAAFVRERLGLPARAVDDVATAVEQADAIVCITKSREPVLCGRDVRPGTHVVLAGSSHLDRVESDPELFARATRVYTDDLPLAQAHGGDLTAAVRAGTLAWADVSTLGAALAEPPGFDPDAVSVFSYHGVGSWDLELARTVYERALTANTGTTNREQLAHRAPRQP